MTWPLDGTRVLDLTTNISGPTLTMVLAALGADVVKVERPEGDDGRQMGPYLHSQGAYFLAINHDKRSVILDLKTPDGVAAARRLARTADVLVENFRVGTLERLGLGYDALLQYNPRLIYCTISAYGERGPDASKPGYDAVLQARTGPMSVTGPEGGSPVRSGVSILDGGSALWAAIGVVAALYEREQTDRGRRIGTSLYETGVAWMNYHLVAYQATGVDPGPQGASHSAFAPYGRFETATDPIVIGISNDRMFVRLCAALDRPHWWKDARFASNADRLAHRGELHELINERLRERPYEAWAKHLETAEVPFSPLQSVGKVLTDAQTAALRMVQEVTLENGGHLLVPLIPLSFDGERPGVRMPPPSLGTHTNEVLGRSPWRRDR